ncbi:MAG: DUF262 domain-containing protein [Pseudomonadota bacterium]|nr:DUF262 domain-containing protein [Pseudomonadota bacterium]
MSDWEDKNENCDTSKIIIVENEDRNSGLMRLKELLKNFFTIPVYQRPYAWTNANFRELLTTIQDSKENNLPAFFGSIIVAEEADARRMNKNYILIDGQQRITSFLILLKLIRDELKQLKDDLDKKKTQENDASKVEEIIEKIIHTRKYIETLDQILSKKDERLKRESGNSPNGEFVLETDILSYIFKSTSISSVDAKNIPRTFKEEVEETGEDFLGYAYYVLHKVQFCFLVVQGKESENYAINIFNTFNSTGEALTIFEFFKSLVHRHLKEQKITDKLNQIETSLDRIKMKKAKQTKYTDRLLLFLTMMNEELHKCKFANFRDKRDTLDKIHKEHKESLHEYVNQAYNLSNFTIKNWETTDHTFDINGEEGICLDFLKSIAHDRVIPTLFKFSDSTALGDVLKACVAFTCLWRGVAADAGTDRIDKQYETIIKELFKKDYAVTALRNALRKQFGKRWEDKKSGERDMTRDEWVKEFAEVNIYKRIKFARFMLFVAFHKSEFYNSAKEFVKSKKKFLNIENYKEYDYKTLEHIIPQSYKTINKIGNLTLLPQKINAKAGNKDFVSKRKIYEQHLESKDYGDGQPYLEILREVVSYNDDSYLDEQNHLNEEAIKERGQRLGHAVWQTLAEDWLGWTGS